MGENETGLSFAQESMDRRSPYSSSESLAACISMNSFEAIPDRRVDILYFLNR